MITRFVAACVFAAGIFVFLTVCPDASFCQLDPSAPDAHSAAFAPPFELSEEHALELFRTSHLESFSADALAKLQSANEAGDALIEQSLSLDIFRSLAAYYRKLELTAEFDVDRVLTRAPTASRTATNAALLGALEFYSRSPLTRNDVQAGLARLNAIATSNAAAAPIQPEIRFWTAEGYRALGKNTRAELEYRAAIEKSSDARLTALTYFRLAELFEREERYAEADSNFAIASRIRHSPLALLSLLRLGAMRRLEGNYAGILPVMDHAESLYDSLPHHIRSSARSFDYTSPLIEELMLQSTEEDRIVGRAPTAGMAAEIGTVPQLIPPFYMSEVDLLRGIALENLGRSAEASDVLAKGNASIEHAVETESVEQKTEQAEFISDALKFERAWSLFRQGMFQDAAAAFLELAVIDTAQASSPILRQSTVPLRGEGLYYDPFLNDTNTVAPAQVSILGSPISGNSSIDTSAFVYNDFPERARYYAGVSLARAGLLDEAAQTLEKLAFAPSMLYSDQALYQLALIRFAQHSYEAQKLLVPVSSEENTHGAYASFLLGELSYRRNDFERAQEYFLNAFANLPLRDTAIRATAHIERGLSLIPLGNWEDAAMELRAYLAEAHESVPGRTDEALFWMGTSYFRAHEYDSASGTFSMLLLEYPSSARAEDAQYAYAWSLFEANDFARAEPEFEKVLVLDSISRYAYDALARAGDAEYALGNIPRANLLYNRATDRPGFDPLRVTRATLMLGITRMKIDSERSAMNAFEYILRKFPQSDITDLTLYDDALSAYAINVMGTAEDNVHTIVTKYPASDLAPRALYVAGEERVRHTDERGALHYFEQVLQSYPRSSEAGPALFALQDALADLKRIPEALSAADTFVARNPNNPISPIVLLRAGEFEMRLKEPDRAHATFQSFLTLYPANASRPHAELLLAESARDAGDTDEAVQRLDTIIARYDSLDVAASAYLDRARIERARGETDSATLDFEHAWQERYYSFDAAPEAMFEEGELFAAERETDSAIRIFLDISRRYPIEASIAARGAIRAGELVATSGKYDSARTIFSSIIAVHPKNELGGAATVQIGKTYLDESDWSKAAAIFTAARREFPLSSETEAERLLYLGRADAHLARKADAIHALHALLDMHGIAPAIRDSASELLSSLQPPAKKKQKHGGNK